MIKPINVGICGIQGYVGQELADLVMQHPHLNLAAGFSREFSEEFYQEMPILAEQNVALFPLAEIEKHATQCDILLLATPPETSMELALKLTTHKVKIIDLSGAFRLSADQFLQWYGISHTAPHLLEQSIYGLSPWWQKKTTANHLLANPGCYATCALMALIPLLKNNIIKADSIIIDAKSGASGAGKKERKELLFCEIANNFFPYKIGEHQHVPEINNALAQFANKTCHVTLTTHMLPIIRGLSMTIYADAESHFKSDEAIAVAVNKAYQSAYGHYSLVQFGEVNKNNNSRNQFLLSLKHVAHTPETHIGYFIHSGKIQCFSCIDNLLKGAASQAIENINTLFNLPVMMGLKSVEV